MRDLDRGVNEVEALFYDFLSDEVWRKMEAKRD